MGKKTKHSMTTIPENSITQEELVTLVEHICQNSINGSVDICQRLHEVFVQYHTTVKDKCFVYDSKLPAIEFSQIDTTSIEHKLGGILLANLTGRIAESLDLTRSLWNEGILTIVSVIKPSEQNYYRTRISDTPLSTPREMFHTPFELRGLIKTARFSVLGFPSLYLTKNLFTAWEETRRSNIETLYASRLQLRQPISLVDLRLRRNFADIEAGKKEVAVRQYLRTIPLIIACSLKVKRDSDAFKPEYIIPQLILHAVIDEMIRRYQLTYRQKMQEDGLKTVDSGLETADLMMEELLTTYGGDKQAMLKDVLDWSNSLKGNNKEAIAATIFANMVMAKYMEFDSPKGKSRVADADWIHYECNKGIRKYAETGLDGIIYSSTRFDHAFWENEDINTDCIVLPVHSLRNFGFCDYLRALFDISEPVGFKPEFLKRINNKGSEKKEYIHSYFGLLEQELKRKQTTHIANFYGTPIPREKDEFEKLFKEQIESLRLLCQLYDKGKPFIVPLMAIVLRNLFVQEGFASLWTLNRGQNESFCDSAFPLTSQPHNFSIRATDPRRIPNNVVESSSEEYDGLIRKEIKDNGDYNLYPLLGTGTHIKWETYSEWQNQVVLAFRDVSYTRKQIIESVANSEGNISPTLPDYYALFRQSTSLRVRVNGKFIAFKQNPVYVSLRQIAWEVLETVEKQY